MDEDTILQTGFHALIMWTLFGGRPGPQSAYIGLWCLIVVLAGFQVEAVRRG